MPHAEPVEVNVDDVRLYKDCLKSWGKHAANDELWERILRWRHQPDDPPGAANRRFQATVRAASQEPR